MSCQIQRGKSCSVFFWYYHPCFSALGLWFCPGLLPRSGTEQGPASAGFSLLSDVVAKVRKTGFYLQGLVTGPRAVSRRLKTLYHCSRHTCLLPFVTLSAEAVGIQRGCALSLLLSVLSGSTSFLLFYFSLYFLLSLQNLHCEPAAQNLKSWMYRLFKGLLSVPVFIGHSCCFPDTHRAGYQDTDSCVKKHVLHNCIYCLLPCLWKQNAGVPVRSWVVWRNVETDDIPLLWMIFLKKNSGYLWAGSSREVIICNRHDTMIAPWATINTLKFDYTEKVYFLLKWKWLFWGGHTFPFYRMLLQ